MAVTFPFIVGHGRSGTTLLRSLLDSHPDVAIPGESGFIPPLLQWRGPFDADQFADLLESYDRLSRWGVNESFLRQNLSEAASPADGIRAAYKTYAQMQGATVYGDKTPTYVLKIRELADAFPESQFIHMIRDGRDVAMSVIEQRWGPTRIAPAMMTWKQHVEAGQRAGLALETRYLEIRYEELIDDPEGMCRVVCAFLGLRFSPVMLDHDASAVRALSMSYDTAAHRHLGSGIVKVRDWRKEMDADVALVAEQVVGRSWLRRMGYPLEHRPAHLRMRIAAKWSAWWWRAALIVRRSARRLRIS